MRVSVGLLSAIGFAACGGTPTPGVARGEELFDTCVPCHGSDGGGDQALGAPNIAGLPQWYVVAQLQKFQSGHRGAHPFDTVGIRMKSMALSLDLDGDVESVGEYVAGMTRVAAPTTLHGDAEAGRTTFQTCAACHGLDASGVEVLNGPPLAGQDDWYLLAQLQKFQMGWRGTDPQDISGATMRPNALMLDDAGMENVVAYIQTLN